jgi:transaldolase
MMNKFDQLNDLGQTVWLDFIRRSFLSSGELQSLVKDGVRGVTSNPSIFDAAIAGSDDYDPDIRQLAASGKSVNKIYETLAFEDIRQAADILRPVFDRTNGNDGYVSLEVNPVLANDTAATISEAKRLFQGLDRPNVMIKIPATREGIPAIEAVISQGINVNVTLIFSVEQYAAAAQAYITGLGKFSASGGNPSKIASVASVFVSRLDTAVDQRLVELGEGSLLGKIAVANTKMVYARFKEIFTGDRWEKLSGQGARVQRPLWASTSTKNPAYSDTLYVDNLIGPHTVNTLPPAALEAFIDHGSPSLTLETGLDEARSNLSRLEKIDVDLGEVTQTLQDDGVRAFAKSFESLMDSIAEKAAKLSS